VVPEVPKVSPQIILARHGRSSFNDRAPIAGHEFCAWVRRYDECGIDRNTLPPEALRALAASAACVLTSDLPRSIESGRALAGNAEVEPDLREAGLPDRISIPIRLHPDICVILARLAWWMNLGACAETVAGVRARAGRVADRLDESARKHGTVLVVGHGMLNRFLATGLRERGWFGPRTLPRAHWSFARFIQNH
jgi:broad specificity phosphatase PhoE